MSTAEPINHYGNHTDTSGMEKIFDVPTSYETADSTNRKMLEVSISEAAKRLSTSERTIWRRIDRGELKSRTKGNKRLVKIPVLETTSTVSSDGHATLRDTPLNASALVDLNSLLRDLQGATYRIGYLEAQLQQSREESQKLLPDLEAKASEAHELNKQLCESQAEIAKIKSTWWFRVWNWFVGGANAD